MKVKSHLLGNAGRIVLGVAIVVAAMLGWVNPMEAAIAGAVLSVETAAGTTLWITAAIPSTFDVNGYDASAVEGTMVAVGEIVSVGAHGRTYAPVTHLPLASRTVQKFKGSRDDGNLDLNLGRDSDDAGQILAKTALDSDANHSFKIQYPGGDREFFQGKVMAMTNAADGADSIVARTISIAITANAAGVGIVESLAA